MKFKDLKYGYRLLKFTNPDGDFLKVSVTDGEGHDYDVRIKVADKVGHGIVGLSREEARELANAILKELDQRRTEPRST